MSISLLAGELVLAGIYLACRVIRAVRHKEVDWKQEAKMLLMYINLAVLLRLTFYPMTRIAGRVQPLVFEPEEIFPLRVDLVPFVQLFWYDSKRDMILNIVGNFTMFIPSGIILPILYRKLDRFWKVLAAGALMSLCIEILQLPFAVRASDIDDLILNVLGVAAGYGIYYVFKHRPGRG